MPEIQVSHEGPVARVIISYPERHNALTHGMLLQMPGIFDELGRDPQTRVIVVTGATREAFAAGGDISEFESKRSHRADENKYIADTNRALLAPVSCAKPVIASIRGFCMGGGLQLAVACDIRIVADDAVFRMPAARLGVGYPPAGIERFIAVIGASNTIDLFIAARKFDAQEALRMGLVNRVVADDALEATVQDMARTIAENAPLTVRCAKTVVGELMKEAQDRNIAATERAVEACFQSADYQEGQAAFMEKRKPRFIGA